jgi:hypothetical protein
VVSFGEDDLLGTRRPVTPQAVLGAGKVGGLTIKSVQQSRAINSLVGVMVADLVE